MEKQVQFELNVAGVQFREGWKETLDKLKVGDILTLVPEPSNKYDSNAIKIVNFDDEHLGYIPAKSGHSKLMTDRMIRGKKYEVKVIGVNTSAKPWDALTVMVKENN